MAELTIDEAAKQLGNYAKMLVKHLDGAMPQIDDVISGKSKLPEGCPSKGSMAAMILRNVEQDVDEIIEVFRQLKSAALALPKQPSILTGLKPIRTRVKPIEKKSIRDKRK